MAVVDARAGKRPVEQYDLVALSQRDVQEMLRSLAGKVAQTTLEKKLAEGYRRIEWKAC
jgi:hypothetical protein